MVKGSQEEFGLIEVERVKHSRRSAKPQVESYIEGLLLQDIPRDVAHVSLGAWAEDSNEVANEEEEVLRTCVKGGDSPLLVRWYPGDAHPKGML